MSLLPQSTEKKEPKKENHAQNKYLPNEQPTPKKTTYLDILAKEPPINQIVNLKDLKNSTINLVSPKVKHSWASEVSSDTDEPAYTNAPVTLYQQVAYM
jgi:hypothetical protein